MPVRKIPMNYRNVTGFFPSDKAIGSALFESTLERDFFTLLDFNSSIDKFEVQPVRIEYIDSQGLKRSYTPDVLVYYHPFGASTNKKIILYEIKHRDELRNNWGNLREKFKAAHRYAKDRNWKFKIITEREIRTPFLENIKFLRQYDLPIHDDRMGDITDLLINEQEMSIETLVSSVSSKFAHTAEAVYLVWQMIARAYLSTNLSLPLNMKSKVSLPQCIFLEGD